MTDNAPPDPPRAGRGFLRHLKHKLGAGLLVVIPLGITIFILRFLFRLADGFLAPYLKRLWEIFGTRPYIPGVGLLVGALLVYFAGLLTSNFFGRRLVHYWDDLLSRLPLVKSIYIAAKQLMEVVAGGGPPFREAVYVDFPLAGTFVLAYVTGDLVAVSGKRYRTCFVPTSPNPTSGFVLVLEEAEVYPTGISVEEAMKITVSGGMVAPDVIAAARLQ